MTRRQSPSVGPAYLREKGKNLATREDIGGITDAIEQARLRYHEELERLKSTLSHESEGMIRKRDLYHRLTSGLGIFVQGQIPPAVLEERKGEFLQAYAEAWLWAPDDLIRSLNAFVLLNQTRPPEDNAKQRELKPAFVDVVLRMRRDAGHPNTSLGFDDFVFVKF